MLQKIHRKLGIPDSYLRNSKMPVYIEPDNLISIGNDIYGRSQMLTPSAAKKWFAMKLAAGEDNVSLYVVSAFRSVSYQTFLIKSKIEKGHSVEDILKVNAAPGCSEHHTGRAIDLTTESSEVLSESFDETDAFKWLSINAINFGFNMSYPKQNMNGLLYEPWHWCCTDA